MKLRLFVFIGLLTRLFVSAQAQTNSSEVVFMDANLKVLAPNTTLNINKVEDAVFPMGWKKMTEKLYFCNLSDKMVKVKFSYSILAIEDGQLQVCALGNCGGEEKVGNYEIGYRMLFAKSEPEEFKVEYSCPPERKCKVLLKLMIEDEGKDGKVTLRDGATLTLNFDATPTGIVSASLQDSSTYDVFNAQGILLHKQVASLPKLSKGIYIVRQKDSKGLVSTLKYVVR